MSERIYSHRERILLRLFFNVFLPLALIGTSVDLIRRGENVALSIVIPAALFAAFRLMVGRLPS